MEHIRVFFQNLWNLPNRIMANFLRKRGWVVFYLDEQARTCNNGTCWLALYQDGKIDKNHAVSEMLASEALYGFAGWLTSFREPVTFSQKHDAAIAADLVAEFCKANHLSDLRDGVWPENFIWPDTRDTSLPDNKHWDWHLRIGKHML